MIKIDLEISKEYLSLATRWPRNKIDLEISKEYLSLATRWPRNKIDLEISNEYLSLATRWPRNKIDLEISKEYFVWQPGGQGNKSIDNNKVSNDVCTSVGQLSTKN